MCGATIATREERSALLGGGCVRCEGSPLCDRCGHPRREHYGTFGRSKSAGFRKKIYADDTLAVSRCGCEGYVRAHDGVRASRFVDEDVPLVETTMPKLRVVDPPSR
jgi:hypothetical protein